MPIEITGIPLKSNIYDYSVQEDATSLDPSAFTGGVGQLTFSADDWDESFRMINSVIDLSDGSRGKFEGVVTETESTDGALNVVADSALTLFNSWHTVPPFSGALYSYIQTLANICGIPNNVNVASSIATTHLEVPGYLGNVWDGLKQFLAAHQWEIALVFNRVTVRPIREIVAVHDNVVTETVARNSQVTAEEIEVYYYNNVWATLKQVYPVPSSDAGYDSPLVVNAGSTLVQQVTIDGTLISVNQPAVQDWVGNTDYSGTNGVYAVAGNDGLPVTAAQWTAKGGRLSVATTDDPSIIEVTVIGADIPELSPFRIAMTAGTASYYDALRITGAGTVWDKRLLTLKTGAAPSSTGDKVGTTVDNRFISTLADAYTCGLKVAATFAGTSLTLSGTVMSLNRPTDSEAYITSTFGDFNLANLGNTLSQFNTFYAGATFEQFNTYWRNITSEDYENQLFGQGVGARILTNDINYRVVSTTTGPANVQYSAVADTTIGDFNGSWLGKTFADFNVQYDGYRFQDFNAVPLRSY